ncbi:unnamed protein product [Effrenium voratum]|uniref:Uncharacterized protein n=2 Tax=Effrenium voratum TaxID=2562239 RepID=A0AA36N4L0_9DINO|nr:unnamed protein product [Effrenium voratum]
MVSPLKDSRSRDLAKTLHVWLKEDMQLALPEYDGRSRAVAVRTFGAWLGLLRASNPLFPQKRATRALRVQCPLTRRFPTIHCGKLSHYEDVYVCVREILDVGDGRMDEDKMWRLILWIFLGNGGYKHQAWHGLKTTHCGKSYRKSVLQPLSVLRYVSMCVCASGGVMRCIGSDGLDKKFRLSSARFMWLVSWHRAVPSLVEAFKRSAEAFRDRLCTIKGLRGDLTQKEIMVILSCARNPAVRKVGEAILPFGQGAKNGAKAFLKVPMKYGREAAEHYKNHLGKVCGELQEVIKELFPQLSKRLTSVKLGDVEPCLCGAVIYSRQAKRLRGDRPADGAAARREGGNRKRSWDWEEVQALQVPAGFIPHDAFGRPDTKAVPLPKLKWAQFAVRKVPPGKLSRHKLLREWGLLHRWPNAGRKFKLKRSG